VGDTHESKFGGMADSELEFMFKEKEGIALIQK